MTVKVNGLCHGIEVNANGVIQFNDPSLLKEAVCYVDGEWKSAISGALFEVTGMVPRSFRTKHN